MTALIHRLQHDYPAVRFIRGASFCWSPADKTVCYVRRPHPTVIDSWSLLHELGHAVLGHETYQSDFALLKLETAAWAEAETLGRTYDISIDYDHIQDCLDTYRDWLHQRSTCPTCGSSSLQTTAILYDCFNCHTNWTVTASRFCRPYRRLEKSKASPAPTDLQPATFL